MELSRANDVFIVRNGNYVYATKGTVVLFYDGNNYNLSFDTQNISFKQSEIIKVNGIAPKDDFLTQLFELL